MASNEQIAKRLDKLKSQLLTSGVQQSNQPLWQVISQLIDSLKEVNAATINQISGGGGGGGLSNQTYLTHQNDLVALPNSRQLWPGFGIQLNDQGQKIVIGAALPFGLDGQDGEDGFIGPPGLIGPQGLSGSAGPMGPPGLDANSEDGEPLWPIPIGILYESKDAIITGNWIFFREPSVALDVRSITGQAIINVFSGSVLSGAGIFLQSQNGQGLLLQKFNNFARLSLGTDITFLELFAGGASAGIALDQIKFPSTQIPSSDPNTLDDYEEGTWTPTLTYDTPGDLNVVYSVRQGSYTKVGQIVRVDFFYVTSTYTFTTASGNLRITGLPFTSGATYFNFGALQPNQVWPTYTDFFCRVNPSESRISFLGYSTGTGAQFLTAANTTSGTQQSMLGTLIYRV